MHFDLLGRRVEKDRAKERAVSAFEHRSLPVPGTGQHARGHVDLVGRRNGAAASGGTRTQWTNGRWGWRSPLHWRQREADVQLLRNRSEIVAFIEDEGVQTTDAPHRA